MLCRVSSVSSLYFTYPVVHLQLALDHDSPSPDNAVFMLNYHVVLDVSSPACDPVVSFVPLILRHRSNMRKNFQALQESLGVVVSFKGSENVTIRQSACHIGIDQSWAKGRRGGCHNSAQ
jgi:hypothetical protein